jgi:5-formyltetrahydrofolate cyclo-ligase
VSDFRQSPDRATAKTALRTRLLAARRALPPEVRAAAAHRVRAALLAAIPAGQVTVAGYVPIGPEPGGPDLPEVLARALPPGGRLLLPVLLPDLALDWALYQPALAPPAAAGRRADWWRAPPGPRLGPAAIGEAALVVTPAVAVDRRGVRLGRGGGSYDRALPLASPGAQLVALLYDGELLLDADLPAEPHDRQVSAAITPSHGLVPLPSRSR